MKKIILVLLIFISSFLICSCNGAEIIDGKISSAKQFLSLQGKELNEDFILTKDIDLGGKTIKPIFINNNCFDGNGYTIKNFVINETIEYSDEYEVEDGSNLSGLFAVNLGTIKNLTISNFEINIIDRGNLYAGSLVGYNNYGAIVSNVKAYGDINIESNTDGLSSVGGLIGLNLNSVVNKVVTDVDMNINLNDEYIEVGGIIGTVLCGGKEWEEIKVTSTLEYAYSLGNINIFSNESLHAAGLIGYLFSGEVNECYSTAPIKVLNNSEKICNINISGLVGYSYGLSINSCFSANDLYVESSQKAHVWALIHNSQSGINNHNCYQYVGQKLNSIYNGISIPENVHNHYDICTQANLIDYEFYTSYFYLGFDTRFWNFDNLDPENDKYPVLK